ncbi:MAG: hypothetical protein WDO13_00095 [Verrucomicrobiota bacterium]
MAGGATNAYAFAGTQPFVLPLAGTSSNPIKPTTAKWPPTQTINFPGLSGLTVRLLDLQGQHAADAHRRPAGVQRVGADDQRRVRPR